MRHAPAAIAFCVFLLLLSFGVSGLWQEDKNYFTMHPFSDPVVDCTVQAFVPTPQGPQSVPLPTVLYRTLPSTSFRSRLYLQNLQAFQAGLEQYALRKHSEAMVEIRCQSVFDSPSREWVYS